MASYSLLYVGRKYIVSPAEFTRTYPHPWLLWNPPKDAGILLDSTEVGDAEIQAMESGEPVAIEIVKGSKPNAFPFGITLGHAENNDIVLRHQYVSRFHAYFQKVGDQLAIIDAESKNGTFVNAKRLLATKPEPLPSQALLRFGMLEVRFFMPERFINFLEQEAGRAR